MNKIIFSILIIFVFAFGAGEVLACSCISNLDKPLKEQVKEAYKSASAVFIAEVIKIDKHPDKYYLAIRTRVEKSWKGTSSRKITITTGQGTGDCGYSFETGKKYLVYAYGEKDGSVGTNICTRTYLAAENKDIAILNKLKRPIPVPK